MGYYTNYGLSVIEGNDELIKEFVESLKDITYALNEDGSCNNSCKWYSHEKDLKDFSKKHPETLFLLEGEGEENGDLWKKYFKDGKMQVCQATITFEKYDESKLI